jgi:hypothetical protein
LADLSLKDLGPAAEDRASFRQSFFGSVVGQAAVLVGLLIFYFGGLAALISFAAPFGQLRAWLETDFGPALGVALFYVILAAPLVAVLLFSALPLALRARSEARLKRAAFEAVPEPPASPFRLAPYGPGERGRYSRLDGQEAAALAWLQTATGSVLYLSGESGVGKSSLVAAHLVPELQDAGWAVLQARAYGDAPGRIAETLRDRRDLFARAPDAKATIRELLVSIAERRRKAGQGPLLVVLDQFEEVLILAEPDAPDPLRALIEDLAARPIDGVKLLLVYRADYETEIFKLDLPPPLLGSNAFRLGRYNRREAEALLKAGGRLPATETRDALFRGLDRIEGAPGLYRQITLNMVGLFLERMGDRLTGDPDKLIQSYLDGAIREGSPDAAAARRHVLETLVSDAGTRHPRREPEIAGLTGLPPHVVRATLHGLADKGLVRALQGVETTWEIAHDFLAALLGRALGRVRPSRWARVRPALGPATVAGWIAVIALGLPWWLQRAEAKAREVIFNADGSIHRMPDGKSLEIRFSNDRLRADCAATPPAWEQVFNAVGRLKNANSIVFTPTKFPGFLRQRAEHILV